MFKKLAPLFLLILTWANVNAQDKKVIKLYEDGLYDEVIKFYQAKHLEESDCVLLTKSLLNVGQNERALEISRMLFEENPNNAVALENFYRALTYDQRYPSAFNLVEKHKKDLPQPLADSLTRDIEKFMIWQYDVQDLDVHPLTKLNTADSEYSPIAYNNSLYYCVLYTVDLTSQDKYDIKESKLENKTAKTLEKTQSFSLNGLKSSEHTNLGPFCIFENNIYYTVSTKNYGGVNNLKIIQATIDDKGKITDESEMEMCDKSYSFAHPAISDDGSKLFFASDMPGGYGGMDLYVSYKSLNSWGSPINLGPWVNTSGNELFPYYMNEVIYFSSDGLDSYGGLDIYQVDDDDNMENVINLKYPINTPFDDFGISLSDVNTGFFSSNRPGGSGDDDLYAFNLRVPDQKPQITGIMKQSGIPIPNAEILLVDLDGNVLDVGTTDENGAFVFDRQPDAGKYGIQLAQPLESNKNVSLSLTDEAGHVTENLTMNSKGIFVFEMFALDEVDELNLFAMYETDPYMIDLYGIVYKEVPGDLNAIYNIEIQDESFNEMAYIKTKDNAEFLAEDLPYGERFLMQVESGEPDLKIAITDKDKNIVQELYSPGNNLYAYQHIGNPDDLTALIDNNNSTNIVMKNESIKIPNIYYGYNSYKLNAKAKKSLDELAETLKKNKGISIELLSHTDSRGTAQSNKYLSEKRAQSAKSYLTKKGVKSSRISANGYGWNKLLIDCLHNDCTEEDHAQNRRTEFQIIGD